MSNPIVQRALSLAQQHPDWSDLQVLDGAMEGHTGTHPDFECSAPGYADWLSPPSPFADLLQRALGAGLQPDDFHAHAERWHDVVDRFGVRYRLWQ
jgi:hypothetical protein